MTGQNIAVRSLPFVLMLMLGIVSGCKTSGTTRGPSSADGNMDINVSRTSSLSEETAGKADPTPAASGQPKTIREFFMALPDKYFTLEGCDRAKDRDCRKAKLDYLKTFTEVEDTANGYLKGGCDGAQSCLEMTIFRKPDSTYLVAVSVEAEMMMEQFFLDYAGGKWIDVGADVIPQYSKRYIYEFPRQGTTVRVYEKKVIEKGDDYEFAEKGARKYELIWQNGKFQIKK